MTWWEKSFIPDDSDWVQLGKIVQLYDTNGITWGKIVQGHVITRENSFSIVRYPRAPRPDFPLLHE